MSDPQHYGLDELTEMFSFLDDLRESGETNMYGARPYLQEEFGMDKKIAANILQNWMRTFSKEEDAATRAAKALAR